MEVQAQTEAVNENTQTQEAPSVTDLDGFSEFQFQGEKYTPEALREIVTGYKQFSETAKQRSEREEFDKHFEVDRVRLLKDPSLADLFRQKYPKDYHWILEFLPKEQRQEMAQPQTAQNALPPEVSEKLKQLDSLMAWKTAQEQRDFQTQVEVAQAQIDKITEPLYKKFPLAEEAAVLARAEALLQSGQKLTEKTWERLIRENHEAVQKRWDQHQGAILKQQQEKGRRAQDMGPGGATPGQAPARPKTFDEAREALMKHVQSIG